MFIITHKSKKKLIIITINYSPSMDNSIIFTCTRTEMVSTYNITAKKNSDKKVAIVIIEVESN